MIQLHSNIITEHTPFISKFEIESVALVFLNTILYVKVFDRGITTTQTSVKHIFLKNSNCYENFLAPAIFLHSTTFPSCCFFEYCISFRIFCQRYTHDLTSNVSKKYNFVLQLLICILHVRKYNAHVTNSLVK